MKNYYTTLEAAKICHVSQGSMIRWIHEGQVPASVTPGGHHRIEARNLKQFLKQLRMPVPETLGKDSSRILLIMESPSLLASARRWIKTSCPVSTIEEAREYFTAGWKASKFIPDLIILDIGKPDSESFKICSHIRALPECRNTPFLILLSSSSEEAQRKVQSLGNSGYVLKPLEKGVFLEKIQTLLKTGFEFKKTGS